MTAATSTTRIPDGVGDLRGVVCPAIHRSRAVIGEPSVDVIVPASQRTELMRDQQTHTGEDEADRHVSADRHRRDSRGRMEARKTTFQCVEPARRRIDGVLWTLVGQRARGRPRPSSCASHDCLLGGGAKHDPTPRPPGERLLLRCRADAGHRIEVGRPEIHDGTRDAQRREPLVVSSLSATVADRDRLPMRVAQSMVGAAVDL